MIVVVDNNKKGDKDSLFKVLKDLKFNFIVLQSSKALRLKDVEGIIFSGGALSLKRKLYIDGLKADFSSLLNYDVPILGICLGHEIIAEAFGAKIGSMDNGVECNSLRINILNNRGIFKELPKHIYVYESHYNYVKNLPSSLVVSASSQRNKVEAFFHKKRPIFGVQFHPEDSGEFGKKILINFLKICKSYRN